MCSCGGRRGAESVEMRYMLDRCSSCVHARALLACSLTLALSLQLAGLPQLLERFPVLDNALPARDEAAVVHYGTNTAKYRGAFAVLTDGLWSSVVIRPRLAVARSHLGRDAGEEVHLPMVLFEDRCFKCTAAYRHVGVKNTGGVLHTLRGRISVRLLRWTCVCGTQVPFDGAQDGLFASTLSTVFTRTYMDVMAQSIFTGNSTLSSAAGVMCFLLESTKSLSGALSTLTRQTLIKALHRFSRTLIVPAALFRCDKCYLSPQRPYPAVIMDGQVISVQRNQSEALTRVEQDLCVVAMERDLVPAFPCRRFAGSYGG
ncbi:hypothetical protein I4F81_012928 [Pyropia yezoensis]|uniref:Uncharacterized protein n=1 Tax=Pyropia yezoensis TaxID=2788 RepID=A0ABQ9T874_PYRYE|nr:hypothetical protein I4F81_012928 [Neopyropia yezoensis]